MLGFLRIVRYRPQRPPTSTILVVTEPHRRYGAGRHMMDCAACASSASRPRASSWTCLINADLVAISHVAARCYFDRVMHEVVTSTAVGRASRHVHFALQWCGGCRKVCVVRLESVRSIAPTALVSRTTRVKPSPGPGGGPKSNPSQQVTQPCTGLEGSKGLKA